LYERWRSDIHLFSKEGMNFDSTWQQNELFDAVHLETILPESKRLKRIAIASGQGPGKTASSVIVGLWRCLRYPDALCIVTAPSMRQCRQWVDECKRLLKEAHPLLRAFIKCYNTRVEINGNDIWGIKTATATRPENLQGIHEKRLTFIADEASGVPRPITETIKGTLSNPDALFIQIGNPNTTDCAFFDCFTTHRDQWHCMKWSAEDTARDYPHIVSPSRNRALELEYGRDSDVYRIRVLGEFPNQDPNALMSIEDLIHCTKTSLLGCASINDILPHNKSIALDYARYGGDESCVARRSGLAIVDYKVFVKCDPRKVTDYAFRLQFDANWKDDQCWYIPDAGGMGQGVVHSFHESGKQVLEFHTQATAFDSSMFADMYSEAWWNLRNVVKEHIAHLPNDARLLKQLSTRQYYTDRKGKIKVETKDEWRDRTKITESPDRADAIAMAFYPHVGLGGRVATVNRKKHIVGSKARRGR
jgi:hypothetical protein